MKFLIVSPKFMPAVGGYYDFPIGLAYISSSLKNNGHEVECLNPNHYYEPIDELMARAIQGKNIDVVATGGLSAHYNQVDGILKTAKSIDPNIITVAGGGLISCEPEMVMEMISADIGVIGEGDDAIVEIADALGKNWDLDMINGIIYKTDKGKIRRTPPREPIKDIDTIPYADYEGFEIEKYLELMCQNDEDHLNFYDDPRLVPLIASRGCPYQCTFCFHPLGLKYRQHSIDYLFKQIDFLVDRYNINGLLVLDELFASKNQYDRLLEFCHRIKEYNIHWFAQLRVDSVNQEVLNLCKESGCTIISYGIESVNNHVLKSLKKHITVEQIESTLEMTYKAGLGNKGNLIFGDKEDTIETVNEGLKWWQKNKRYQINLSVLAPYPGTELYHYAFDKGLIRDKREYLKDNHLINLTNMTDKQFQDMIRYNRMLRLRHCKIPAHTVSCRKVRVNKLKGAIYSLEITCPHCGKNILYKNMNHNIQHLVNGSYMLYCRDCGQKFSVLPFNVEERIEEILSTIGDRKTAIWDNNTHFIFEIGSRLMKRMDYIISTNPDRLSGTLLKKEIIHYTGDNKEISDLADYIVYPIKDFKKEYFEQISKLEQAGIKVLKLYAFEGYQDAVGVINGLRKSGDLEEVTVVLKQARDQFPICPFLENLESEIAIEKGNVAKAKEMFMDIISRWRYDWQAYNNLATLTYVDGDIQGALKLLYTALGLSPQNSLVMDNIEQCKRSM